MQKDKKIAQLQQILTDRLPHIKRWKKVKVTDYDNTPEWIRTYAEMDKDSIMIHWNGQKPKNIHKYELKEVPLSELDQVIYRNTERLKHERPIYK